MKKRSFFSILNYEKLSDSRRHIADRWGGRTMKVIKWIYAHAEEVILCILLTAIVLFSGAQVVSRYVFGNSLT